MKNALIRCAAVALLVGPILASAACAPAPMSIAEGKYSFTVIDYPGSSLTNIYGINSNGDLVGTYQVPTGRDATVLPKGVQNASGKMYHGFVSKGGKFTTIDYPNLPGKTTDYTIATSIDTVGNIVGYYASEGEPLTTAYGFTLTKDGSWATVPNKVDASMGEPTMRPSPMRILPDGTQYG